MSQDMARWTSLPGMMLGLAARHPEQPMIRHWEGGGWKRTTWRDFALAVANVAAGLRAQGVSPGDRVVLVSDSRPEFLIADTAIMAIGAVTVPTYTTNTVQDHAHILRDSGARVAIAGTARLAQRLREAAGEAGLDLLVCLEDAPGILAWSTLAATPGDLAMLVAEVQHIPEGRLACLIYTSGTGGLPKGVMLPHRAMLANTAGVRPFLHRLGLEWTGACYLSFLPLSHAYEHTVGGFLFPACGIEIVFSRGAERLAAEFQEVQPQLITAVPRLFEVLRGRILAGLEKEKPWKRGLFERAVTLGLRRMDGPPLNLLEKLEDAVLDRLVRRKVQARFGSRLVAMVSGGARLDPDLSGFFLALGVTVLQGYGQTEAGPVVSVNLPWDNHRRTVGAPVAGVEARIAEDGELLVRGPLVMDGYWGDPESTARALSTPPGEDDPWLHTGDVGTIDEAGRITITDRKKDFIKTLGGDMVSPARIETLLMAEPEIAQAVVAGEGRPGIVALVVPAEGASAEKAIQRINGKLSGPERIRKWTAVSPFTVEDGTLTPTMKVKRRIVLERNAGAIADLYG
ncbi:long-chain fatty acid--CoA ligase [Roseomonas sp. SSH11]|uniref:Long-chain fatty acid--CoA ligase n=1 Tax=Pararoseomonas baculiformis TaxID=2820812 RepID=A0ABS4A9S9_9PROT|nr:long-chain fatty acid--CoA ligase [Pararoseomonas baculiformis]MBP0443727.1 long-chain fatty acid--CoA ligase [Pararoseomonas baculiformis]